MILTDADRRNRIAEARTWLAAEMPGCPEDPRDWPNLLAQHIGRGEARMEALLELLDAEHGEGETK